MNLYQVLILFVEKETDRVMSGAADVIFALNETLAFVDFAVRVRANLVSNNHDPDKYYFVPVRVSLVPEFVISAAHTYALAKSMALLQAHTTQTAYQLEQIRNENITPRCVTCGESGHSWDQCPALTGKRSDITNIDFGGPSVPPGPFDAFFRSLNDETGSVE